MIIDQDLSFVNLQKESTRNFILTYIVKKIHEFSLDIII